MGSDILYALPAYGQVTLPLEYGSGGSPGGTANGGGVVHLVAHNYMEIDGEITVDGADATVHATGGGAGGSILLQTQHFTG